MIGQVIVFAVVAVIAFFSARSTLRGIRAELRGEGTCSGCSGGCAGCGKTGDACCACMQQMEELKKLKERKRQCSDSRKEK